MPNLFISTQSAVCFFSVFKLKKLMKQGQELSLKKAQPSSLHNRTYPFFTSYVINFALIVAHFNKKFT